MLRLVLGISLMKHSRAHLKMFLVSFFILLLRIDCLAHDYVRPTQWFRPQEGVLGLAAAVAMNSDELLIVGADLKNSAYVFSPTILTENWINMSFTGQGALAPSNVGVKVGQDSGNITSLIGVRMWTQLATLVPAGGSTGRFGAAVALMGDTAMVGAPTSDSVYVFHTLHNAGSLSSAWTQQAKLVPNNGATGEAFGANVAVSVRTSPMDGSSLLVSAYSAQSNQGAAYIFQYAQSTGCWSQNARLVATAGIAQDSFGSSVSLDASGDVAMVGATGVGSGGGAVYIFARSFSTNNALRAWSQQAVLKSSNIGERFGSSCVFLPIAVPNSIIAVGAKTAGRAYVFQSSSIGAGRLTAWSMQAMLIAADAGAGAQFGAALATTTYLAEGTVGLLVGAPAATIAQTTGVGSAFLFAGEWSRSDGSDLTWNLRTRLQPQDSQSSTLFAHKLLLSDTGEYAISATYAASAGKVGSIFAFRDESEYAARHPPPPPPPPAEITAVLVFSLIGAAAVAGLLAAHQIRKHRKLTFELSEHGAPAPPLQMVSADEADSSLLGMPGVIATNQSSQQTVESMPPVSGEEQRNATFVHSKDSSSIGDSDNDYTPPPTKASEGLFGKLFAANLNAAARGGAEGGPWVDMETGNTTKQPPQSSPRTASPAFVSVKRQLSFPLSLGAPAPQQPSGDALDDELDPVEYSSEKRNAQLTGVPYKNILSLRARDLYLNTMLSAATSMTSYMFLAFMMARKAEVPAVILIVSLCFLVLMPWILVCMELTYPRKLKALSLRTTFHHRKLSWQLYRYIFVLTLLCSLDLARFWPWRQNKFSLLSRGFPTRAFWSLTIKSQIAHNALLVVLSALALGKTFEPVLHENEPTTWIILVILMLFLSLSRLVIALLLRLVMPVVLGPRKPLVPGDSPLSIETAADNSGSAASEHEFAKEKQELVNQDMSEMVSKKTTTSGVPELDIPTIMSTSSRSSPRDGGGFHSARLSSPSSSAKMPPISLTPMRLSPRGDEVKPFLMSARSTARSIDVDVVMDDNDKSGFHDQSKEVRDDILLFSKRADSGIQVSSDSSSSDEDEHDSENDDDPDADDASSLGGGHSQTYEEPTTLPPLITLEAVRANSANLSLAAKAATIGNPGDENSDRELSTLNIQVSSPLDLVPAASIGPVVRASAQPQTSHDVSDFVDVLDSPRRLTAAENTPQNSDGQSGIRDAAFVSNSSYSDHPVTAVPTPTKAKQVDKPIKPPKPVRSPAISANMKEVYPTDSSPFQGMNQEITAQIPVVIRSRSSTSVALELSDVGTELDDMSDSDKTDNITITSQDRKAIDHLLQHSNSATTVMSEFSITPVTPSTASNRHTSQLNAHLSTSIISTNPSIKQKPVIPKLDFSKLVQRSTTPPPSHTSTQAQREREFLGKTPTVGIERALTLNSVPVSRTSEKGYPEHRSSDSQNAGTERYINEAHQRIDKERMRKRTEREMDTTEILEITSFEARQRTSAAARALSPTATSGGKATGDEGAIQVLYAASRPVQDPQWRSSGGEGGVSAIRRSRTIAVQRTANEAGLWPVGSTEIRRPNPPINPRTLQKQQNKAMNSDSGSSSDSNDDGSPVRIRKIGPN